MDYDVLVCGGGSAGFATALNAARGGLKVGLAEMMGELGGILTAGCVNYVMDATADTGIIRELRRLGTVHDVNGKDFMVDGERIKLFLEETLESAGVELMYFTRACAATVREGRIQAVTLQDKLGGRDVSARAYVDCTGDGDLAYFAGAGFDYGMDGAAQPLSFEVVVTGIAPEDARPFLGNYDNRYQPQAWKNLLAEFRRAGIEPSYPRPHLALMDGELYGLNVNHQYLSGLDPRALTRATLEGRREVFAAVDALRSLGGIWKNIRIVRTPSLIGSREGRRIHGKYTVTTEDLIHGSRFDDAACHVTFNVDIHSRKGYETGDIKVQPYDVPLRALMSRDLDNLYMAGRDISGDYYAHASYRVTGNTFVMGESLGAYLAQILC